MLVWLLLTGYCYAGLPVPFRVAKTTKESKSGASPAHVNPPNYSFFTCNVSLPADVVYCNNASVDFGNNLLVSYSTNIGTDTYLWNITDQNGVAANPIGGTNTTDRFPKYQLNDGSIYKVIVNFTNGSGTCADTMLIYKNVFPTADASAYGLPDTSVCNGASVINIYGSSTGPITNTQLLRYH